MESMVAMKSINPEGFISNDDCNEKSKKPTKKHSSLKKSKFKYVIGKKTKTKRGYYLKMTGGEIQQNIEKKIESILETERQRFGIFLDQISLKTESGILPVLRIFESHDENIMACIYYGFYMRLSVNFYQKKYVIKLSKIDAGLKNSYLEYNKSSPSLTIYQNLTINNGVANMGIVSKLSPRIINAFI